MESETGNVEEQWNDNKKCVSMHDLVAKVERSTTNLLVTQEAIIKWMNEGSGRMSTTKKEKNTKKTEN
jgi:uncharacterized protein YtpQ (UPF0354 family)